MAYLEPEYALRKLLRDSATVQAALNSDYTVCTFGDIPRVVNMPYVAYQRTSASPEHHMGGVCSSGLWMGSTEFTVFAESHVAAVAAAKAMRGVLDGLVDQTVTISADSVTFERCFLEREDADYFDPKDASDTRVHTISQEYSWSARP